MEPQTDFTPPSLTSYSISKTEIEAGKRLKIDFEAADLDSKLGSIDFRFQNEIGNSISINGDGQLGVASRQIDKNQMICKKISILHFVRIILINSTHKFSPTNYLTNITF